MLRRVGYSGLQAAVGAPNSTRTTFTSIRPVSWLKLLRVRGAVGGVQSAQPRRSPAGESTAPEAGRGPDAFDELIKKAAGREGVDAELVKAVVAAESGFNPKAVSSAGAKGLMQLMDGTARSLGVKNSFDPAANIAGGTKFLRSMLDKFGSVPLALAAYNAGPGAVDKFGDVPPYAETRSYVDRVLSLRQRYEKEAMASARQGGRDGGRITA